MPFIFEKKSVVFKNKKGKLTRIIYSANGAGKIGETCTE